MGKGKGKGNARTHVCAKPSGSKGKGKGSGQGSRPRTRAQMFSTLRALERKVEVLEATSSWLVAKAPMFSTLMALGRKVEALKATSSWLVANYVKMRGDVAAMRESADDSAGSVVRRLNFDESSPSGDSDIYARELCSAM